MEKSQDQPNESRDEVDFAQTPQSLQSPKKDVCNTCTKKINPLRRGFNRSSPVSINNNNEPKPLAKSPAKKCSIYGDCEIPTAVKNHLSTLEKFHLFHFPLRKKSEPLITTEKPLLSPKEKPKLIKSSSIARLFGNNYNTKKSEERNSPVFKKSHSNLEKFYNRKNDSDASTGETVVEEKTKDYNDNTVNLISGSSSTLNIDQINNMYDKHNMKAIRSLTKGLGKLLRRNCDSADISAPDPEYKVFYLGNVLTGWAKGDACIEKPLATLWRNYTQNSKPEVLMRLKVCPSGLKATTRQHGLTEYWSHRITFCSAPKNYPKVFCWIYRHEGRKLKHELRCHAVICSKENQSCDIANVLKENLAIALREFKRDKMSKQNARLSLSNAIYDNPSMPRRKILLSTGANNYRPPLERSKSAPKLMAIEEIIGEEEEEEIEDAKESKMAVKQFVRPCCKEDYLYPSITLGRKRCRREHSFRRGRLRSALLHTQKSYPPAKAASICKKELSITFNDEVEHLCQSIDSNLDLDVSEVPAVSALHNTKSYTSSGSDEDFESFLLCNNYDSKDALSSDLMSYFDMKLQNPTPSLTTGPTTVSMHDLTHEDTQLKDQRATLSLDNLVDYQSDNELDDDDVFFNQDSFLNTLRRQSKAPGQHFILDDKNACTYDKTESFDLKYSYEPSMGDSAPSSLTIDTKVMMDSDDGSISSGCETLSTVTTTEDSATPTPIQKPIPLPRRSSVLDRVRSFEQLANAEQMNREPLGGGSGKFNRKFLHPNGTGGFSKFLSLQDSEAPKTATLTRGGHSSRMKMEAELSDDELSDESGYVEFQDNSLKSVCA